MFTGVGWWGGEVVLKGRVGGDGVVAGGAGREGGAGAGDREGVRIVARGIRQPVRKFGRDGPPRPLGGRVGGGETASTGANINPHPSPHPGRERGQNGAGHHIALMRIHQ